MSYRKLDRRPGMLGLGADAAPATSAAPLVDSSTVKTAAGVALVYHGYKRTGSVLWALIYGALGRVSPLVTGAVAVAQGFGKRKEG
jgi:hypothetical protein